MDIRSICYLGDDGEYRCFAFYENIDTLTSCYVSASAMTLLPPSGLNAANSYWLDGGGGEEACWISEGPPAATSEVILEACKPIGGDSCEVVGDAVTWTPVATLS